MKQIPLTGIVGKGMFALVSDEDYERVSARRWWAVKGPRTTYVQSRIGREKHVSLHRFILNPPKDKVVDHIDGNGWNCQRENMRICTISENTRHRSSARNSTSKYLGVHYAIVKDKRISKATGKLVVKEYGYWIAQIRINGKSTRLGFFKDEKQAALKFNEAAKIHHGEFAKLNIITT